jgi:hypothetical protein
MSPELAHRAISLHCGFVGILRRLTTPEISTLISENIPQIALRAAPPGSSKLIAY